MPTYLNINIFFFFISISGRSRSRIRNIFPAELDPDPWKKMSDPHPCTRGFRIIFLNLKSARISLYINRVYKSVKGRDVDPKLFSTDPDPAQLEKYSGSGSDLKSK